MSATIRRLALCPLRCTEGKQLLCSGDTRDFLEAMGMLQNLTAYDVLTGLFQIMLQNSPLRVHSAADRRQCASGGTYCW
jgi:hypothetical protein